MGTPTPVRMSVDGRALACVACRGGTFTKRTVTMLTSGIANTGFNKVADAVTCSTCGFIHHFVTGVVSPAGEG